MGRSSSTNNNRIGTIPRQNCTPKYYIGFRWAHNLAAYKAQEPQRMVRYYKAAARTSPVMLAKAESTR